MSTRILALRPPERPRIVRLREGNRVRTEERSNDADESQGLTSKGTRGSETWELSRKVEGILYNQVFKLGSLDPTFRVRSCTARTKAPLTAQVRDRAVFLGTLYFKNVYIHVQWTPVQAPCDNMIAGRRLR
jgi:hypothetical protein